MAVFLIDKAYRHLIEWCKKLSFFCSLTQEDQIGLIKGAI